MMTQINIHPDIAEKLEQLSKETSKSLDDVLYLLLTRYSHTLEADNIHSDDVTWTDEEVQALLTIKETLSSQKIAEKGLLGTWSDENIHDGQEWVEQQRASRR